MNNKMKIPVVNGETIGCIVFLLAFWTGMGLLPSYAQNFSGSVSSKVNACEVFEPKELGLKLLLEAPFVYFYPLVEEFDDGVITPGERIAFGEDRRHQAIAESMNMGEWSIVLDSLYGLWIYEQIISASPHSEELLSASKEYLSENMLSKYGSVVEEFIATPSVALKCVARCGDPERSVEELFQSVDFAKCIRVRTHNQ